MKILIAESAGFSERAIHSLREVAEVVTADLDAPGLLEAIADADVLWVRLRHVIGRQVLDNAPKLQAVITATTGLDHIDLEACQERGIEVFSLKGERAFLKDILATAEHTVLLMLAWLRRLPAATQHVEEGGWNRDLFRGGELRGRTVGVIGYGRLGTLVARILNAFGAEVLTYDPYVDAEQVEAPTRWVEREELLARASIVSLHIPLNETTTHLINADVLAQLRVGSVLINTSRGAVVDERAVLDALRTNALGGYATDVLSDERSSGMGHHPLVQAAASDPRVLVTPHIGGATWESTHKTEEFLADRVTRWIRAR